MATSYYVFGASHDADLYFCQHIVNVMEYN